MLGGAGQADALQRAGGLGVQVWRRVRFLTGAARKVGRGSDGGVGRLRIVSFRGMDDADRCALFAAIMDATFERCSRSESESPKMLIVIEEAHRFIKRRVTDSARSQAGAAERALDRTVREGRKYGCQVAILSQTIRDFAYDAASVRQNIGTRVFMANSDRELEYAADFLDHSRVLTKLPPGTGLFCNAAWGAVTVRLRPPYSKVWEYSEAEIAAQLRGETSQSQSLSGEAMSALAKIAAFHRTQARGPIVSELAAELGMTSKRRLMRLIDELESSGRIRTRRLPERGKPRLIELIEPNENG